MVKGTDCLEQKESEINKKEYKKISLELTKESQGYWKDGPAARDLGKQVGES